MVGRGSLVVGAALLALLGACDREPPPGRPSSASSPPGGLSVEQYCADAGTAFLGVAATEVAGGVLVTWDDAIFRNQDPGYRVYRRAGGEWARVADLPGPPAGGEPATRWVDEAPVTGADEPEYGVTVVDGTCGELPLCDGEPCATTKVAGRPPSTSG